MILSREFEVFDIKSTYLGTVKLTINKPIIDRKKGGDWVCNYKILKLNNDYDSQAYGIDSLQSLLLCLKKIETELKHYEKSHQVKLFWLEREFTGLNL